jgi:hypothetical protein
MASNGGMNGNVNWDLAEKITDLFIIGISSAFAEVADENQENVIDVSNLTLTVDYMNKTAEKIIFI